MWTTATPSIVRSDGPNGRRMQGRVAGVMRYLLDLPGDNSQLVHMAAAAVLVAKDGRTSQGWSTQEMDRLRADVKLLEAGWQRFTSGVSGDEVIRSAALYLAFREMEVAVRGGELIPGYGKLVIQVAKSLLGGEYGSTAEVEDAVRSLTSSCSACSPAALVEEAIMLGCGSAAAAGANANSASRVAAVIGSMITQTRTV
eukprot:gnl/TRDRNA2_/TRDRNA2_127964_c0_seq1.p1 gnl/TRDRNA2_/TRDRNA2_127964_c0~~gnl/TRDRNA2_/TRDRNA2_127964_c0_seq1.p1  ORF type:complete len:199 (-),score=29.86 gnl/TRDRNA2_/TRDRNA2_127964_c0_seq1:4-600(-)